MIQQTVTALVGAQFGSEGKGLIAEKLANRFDLHVRTGAPNAGHTYYVDAMCNHRDVGEWGEHYANDSGVPTHHSCPRCGDLFPNIGDDDLWQTMEYRQKVVARSVPCGAANRNARLFIGPGGLIDLDLLIDEVIELDGLGLDVSSRLMVDRKAMIIDPLRHHHFEGGVRGNAHAMIGSTGEGVGPARMAKIARGTFNMSGSGPAWGKIDQVAAAQERLLSHGIVVGDVARTLNTMYDRGASILLEGTQGSGLSLVHGPWPYVTSSDTNAAQLAVDAGLAPRLIENVILVARTYPIRVAGNSGPLPKETSWEEIGQPEERTTVTKKVRRVGYWTDDLVRRAIMFNRPSEIALTFGDYLHADVSGCTEWEHLPRMFREYISEIEVHLGVGITMIGTGPDTIVHNTGQERVPASVFLSSDTQPDGPTGWPTDIDAYGVPVLA